MGNNLCKARVDHANNSKNPIDRVIGRCVRICPSAIGKKDNNYWQKHIFETSPPSNISPKPNGTNDWHNATLNVSYAPNAVEAEAPVAPPRRKRSSQIIIDDKPGGFKEVFGEFNSLPSNVTSTSKIQPPLINQRSVSSEDFADFSKDINEDSDDSTKRRISKVGNKKSDKFFGENLSDCLSNEPMEKNNVSITPERYERKSDEIDAFVEKNVKPISSIQVEVTRPVQVEQKQRSTESAEVKKEIYKEKSEENSMDTSKSRDRSSSLNKRAEFLMTLLEGDPNIAIDESSIVKNEKSFVETPKKPVQPIPTIKRSQSTNPFEDDDDDIIPIASTPIKNISSTHETNSEGNIPKAEKHVNFVFKQQDLDVTDKEEVPPEYSGMKPVDEPIIIPKRKHHKHICDDDDHIHKSIRPKTNPPDPPEITDVKKIESVEVIAPKKPQRDMEKYERSLERKIENAVGVEKPMRKYRRSVSRENLPAPPARPERRSEIVRPTYTQLITSEINHLNNNNESLPQVTIDQFPKMNLEDHSKEKIESMLKKCNSSQSFLTEDIMSDIANKVYDFTLRWTDTHHIHLSDYDDCSSQVAPVSKVATRKISTSRMEREKSIKEEVEAKEKAKNLSALSSETPSVAVNDIPDKMQAEKVSVQNFLMIERQFSAPSSNDNNRNPLENVSLRKTGNVPVPDLSNFQNIDEKIDKISHNISENPNIRNDIEKSEDKVSKESIDINVDKEVEKSVKDADPEDINEITRVELDSVNEQPSKLNTNIESGNVEPKIVSVLNDLSKSDCNSFSSTNGSLIESVLHENRRDSEISEFDAAMNTNCNTFRPALDTYRKGSIDEFNDCLTTDCHIINDKRRYSEGQCHVNSAKRHLRCARRSSSSFEDDSKKDMKIIPTLNETESLDHSVLLKFLDGNSPSQS